MISLNKNGSNTTIYSHKCDWLSFSDLFGWKVINVYQQEYESAGAFWPHVHTRIISSLIMQQISLLGLLATKKASQCTPILIFLPILTIAFNLYCKSRFEPAFRKYPLEVSLLFSFKSKRVYINSKVIMTWFEGGNKLIFFNYNGYGVDIILL